MSCNGYANYQTWAVCLWLDNEQDSQREAKRIANKSWSKYDNESALKTWVREDLMPDLGASLASDLLNGALSEVNWSEVQEHFQNED